MVEGIYRAMFLGKPGAVYNIASERENTINDALRILLELESVLMSTVTYKNEVPSMIPVRKIDISKASSDLHFQNKTSLREGLAKTVDWYKAARKQ